MERRAPVRSARRARGALGADATLRGGRSCGYGPQLAATLRVATIAIADEISASDPATLSNDAVAAIAEGLKGALRDCNARGLTCDVVDLRFSSTARLLRYHTLVLLPFVRPPTPTIAARLVSLARSKLTILTRVPNERGSGITVLSGPRTTFGLAVNWSGRARRFGGRTWTGTHTFNVPAFTVGARDARLFVLAGRTRPAPVLPAAAPAPSFAAPATIDLNARQAVPFDVPSVPAGEARAVRGSAFGSGEGTVTLANANVVAVLVPDGGARLVAFASRRDLPRNSVNATGALRDDVLLEPPPSTTDRIAPYTHSYPAGTFNRPYRTEIVQADGAEAAVRFTYQAPDLPGEPRFEKTVRLAADATRLVVDERVIFDGRAPEQRALTRSALAVAPADALATDPSFVSWSRGRALAVSWLPAAVDGAEWKRYGSNGTLTLTWAATALRVTYALGDAADPQAAQAFAQRERDWLAAIRSALSRGEVAKWYTQSPQKRPSVSSCGFESHLPHHAPRGFTRTLHGGRGRPQPVAEPIAAAYA